MWRPSDGLQYKMQFGPDFRFHRHGNFLDEKSISRGGGKNSATRSDGRYFAWTLDNMLLYNKMFDDHIVGLTLLQSASKYNYESSSMSEVGVTIPSFLWNNMGAIDITDAQYQASMGTGLSESALSSYMARVNYSFRDRYLLTASARWDGSSVLAEGNKWDFFPSMALGWRMEQEDFIKNAFWIDQLKFRVGVGVTSNSSVSPYGTQGVISSYWMPFSTGNSQIFVTNEPYYTNGSNAMPNKKTRLGEDHTVELRCRFQFPEGTHWWYH